MSSDSDSESSAIDNPPPVPTQDDPPSPPISLMSGVRSEGATTVEGSALSSGATSLTPRSVSGTSTPRRINSLDDESVLTNVDQQSNLSKFFCNTY